MDDFDFVFPDPMGDTFGSGPVQLDIESTSASVDDDAVTIRFDFFTPIAPDSSSMPESVVGFIDLDVDQNADTGGLSFQSFAAPPEQQGGLLGSEARIDLGSENNGLVNLQDTATSALITQLPINFGSDFFEIELSRDLDLLSESEGINYGAILGTVPEATDAAPNTTFATISFDPPTLHPMRWMTA